CPRGVCHAFRATSGFALMRRPHIRSRRQPANRRPAGRASMTSEADVRRICLSLPETIEKPYERRPGFRVRDKLFARLRERPDALVVWRPDVSEKEALIASEPHDERVG